MRTINIKGFGLKNDNEQIEKKKMLHSTRVSIGKDPNNLIDNEYMSNLES